MRAYVAMLPRLHAEEQLAAIQATAVGSGHLRKPDMMAALNRLESRAAGYRLRARANPLILAAIGIAVVDASAPEEDGNG